MSQSLRILHFNDVYRVTPQKTPQGNISVTQFAQLLSSRANATQERALVLFSGDAFSPSVESTVTRGSHMVPVLNEFKLDVALTGNHDFDFGYPHLTKLIKDCNFPWILSNIHDSETGAVPEGLKEFIILERGDIKIGVIGVAEQEWITTIPSWPPNFKYQDMAEIAINLSKKLRDPAGEWRCDLVIALTHSRLPNDIALAKVLDARPSSSKDVASSHGVDLILGGHDHLYYASKGCAEWDGFDIGKTGVLGAEEDDGVLVIKSGTDFRDLSELVLELEDTPSNAIRKKVIKSLKGKRYSITPDLPASENMEKLLSDLLSNVSSHLKVPLCNALVPLDLRSELIRTEESAAPNWFADSLFHCYDESLCMKGLGGTDIVFLCAGALRGDSVYGPGPITLGDIMEILPFEDPLVVIEITGATLWEALESALKPWPAQEGRFPVIGGLRVTWNSTNPPGHRVLEVSIERLPGGSSACSTGDEENENVPQDSTKKYKVMTREYMAQGHDGYEAFKGANYLIDDENGVIMSSLVRKYLLGSQFIHKMQQKQSPPSTPLLFPETSRIISRARLRWMNLGKRVLGEKRAANRDAYNVSGREHMQVVDVFDGGQARAGKELKDPQSELIQGLIEIKPEVDGRLKDVGRSRL
ncbi:hypothetical protein M422DRAFT_213016 [Sphaerobolus stellatus SS14]|uniref:Metallo-dependent phosphatase n=1 Tax=Sphaerobolus stellatus (strain SS14) TaxID=990650 RepID=A0A0C9UIC3_SPHS4|nr:hypothetical protein M422DRAFT_213016 [Sphaerobolus stellatus SS14]